MFITPAYAQAASESSAFNPMSFLPLVLIFVVFYFLLIRPQQKKVKEHREMVATLRRGDRVVTSGGLIGTISRVVSDSEVLLEIAEGVRVRAVRTSITDVITKPEPASAKSDDEKDKD
ncbi:MAG TPA: preprotein translocase subunit YajC [Alphaproteobacteria bacterium]|jgi:preprotein translocase subunit YajC|nr:preprotein translocase subunit YajC [Alphaproteobacteria bacterium]